MRLGIFVNAPEQASRDRDVDLLGASEILLDVDFENERLAADEPLNCGPPRVF
jgi:hypothetical protein